MKLFSKCLILLFVLGSCTARKVVRPSSSNEHACKIIESKLDEFQDYLQKYRVHCDTSKLENDSCALGYDTTIDLVLFFTNLTGLEHAPLSFSFGGAAYQSFNAAEKDFKSWKIWFAENKWRVFLDDKTDIGVRCGEI